MNILIPTARTTSQHMMDKTIFTDDQMRAAAPSIFATGPLETVSSRYSFVNTIQLVDYMREEGYEVSGVHGGVRFRSRTHGPHAIRLRHVDSPKAGDVCPEIVLTNSHDGKSSARLHMGLFRFICANGMVVGETFHASVCVSHIGDTKTNLMNGVRHFMDSAPRLGETINTWKGRMMSDAEIEEFGNRASKLRPANGQIITDPYMHGSLTSARRNEDAHNNLWNVFNRTQEKLLRGGSTIVTPTGKVRRTRALRAVKPVIQLNQDLWDLATEFLPN